MTSMFAPKAAAPTPTPAPTPAATMPDDQSPAVLEARRRKAADIMARGGRTSTILTTEGQRGSDTTLGDTYASPRLGSG